MKKPWQIWTLFALSLCVVVSAMGWVSRNVVRLERENIEIQRQSAYEETVRLALWRMDSAISLLVIEESSRPFYDYNAFNLSEVVNPNALNRKDESELVPSSLLTQVSTNVLVYFNGAYVGEKEGYRITSPQVPSGKMLELAEKNYDLEGQIGRNNDLLNDFIDNVGITNVTAFIVDNQVQRSAEMQVANANESFNQEIPNQVAQNWNLSDQQRDGKSNVGRQGMAQAEQYGNQREFSARSKRQTLIGSRIQENKKGQYKYQKGKSGKARNSKREISKEENSWGTSLLKGYGRMSKPAVEQKPTISVKTEAIDPVIDEDIMKPLWIDDFLVLARKVKIDGVNNIQGAWLNWDSIKQELLGEIKDILPSANLIKVTSNQMEDKSRMLAALPVRLIPGPATSMSPILAPPLQVPLMIAWVCVLLAAFAFGTLLVGAVSLSERRGAFVSAVTHELRTPLTTFRMYSEMLSEGMVTSEEKKQQYLNTLSAEGSRLSHLVENVLSYARLERGRPGGRAEVISVEDLFERVSDRLSQRAVQAGMVLEVSVDKSAESVCVRTDTSVVEQILFNIVDNACKYAVAAENKTIHMEASKSARTVICRVRDHGPGIAAGEAAKLFRPFFKSAKHAAESAPGVGLGLALSRRLARQMGGNLKPHSNDQGACFELTMPVCTEE